MKSVGQGALRASRRKMLRIYVRDLTFLLKYIKSLLLFGSAMRYNFRVRCSLPLRSSSQGGSSPVGVSPGAVSKVNIAPQALLVGTIFAG